MIAASAIALRKAAHALLIADTALLTRLGGPAVFDEAPRNTSPPCVTLGEIRSRDWSTSTDKGAEHNLIIEIWSQHHGAQEALEIASLVAQALETGPVTLSGHHLVSLRAQSLETRRENNGRTTRARQLFRVITEQN